MAAEVPNAPCGVERQVFRQLIDYAKGLFLMHRVELKAVSIRIYLSDHPFVPNAPCGVESVC